MSGSMSAKGRGTIPDYETKEIGHYMQCVSNP